MDYRRKIIASSPHLSHAEGAVASFPDGTDLPLKNLMVNIEPVQSGTGDPSPSNIRPISGWDAVGVHNGNTVVTTISLGRTVYGGTLDVVSGVLTVNRVGVDGGDVTWTKSSSYQYGKFSFLASGSLFDNLGYNVISSSYKAESNDGASATGDMYVWVRSTHRIHVKDSSKDALTAAEFKTAMAGVKFVYKLATPQTYTLDPQTVRSLVGNNNIFSDTGNTSLDYWAHP